MRRSPRTGAPRACRRHAWLLFCALCVIAAPRSAQAEPNPFLAIAQGLSGERRDVTWPVLDMVGAYQSRVAGSLTLTGGVAWGWHSTGLFEPSSLHRATFSSTTSTESLDRYRVSAMFGHLWEDLLSIAIDAGVTARLSEHTALGPVVTVAPGMGAFRLQGSSWVFFSPDTRISFSIGACLDLGSMLR
ncbi:MAG: hypothetical protein HY898_30075 [Deltaproteobacteria bacterium]|nr:hypothetical protein [Deltaproteobacteria bacterium]